MKENYLKLLKPLVLCLLFLTQFTLFSQEKDNEYVMNLYKNIADLELAKESLSFQLNLKKQLKSEIDGKEQDSILSKEIDSLELSLIRKKIKIYETRSKLPASDPKSIQPINLDIENNQELKQIKASINLLETLGKLNEEDTKLLKAKKDKLKRREIEINREILKAYTMIDQKNEPIFSERNLDVVSEKTRQNIKRIKDSVIDKYERYIVAEESKKAFKNTKITYKATIFNTYFSVPIARFNRVKNDDNKEGNVQLFNSVGAGISLKGGRITDIRDSHGELIDTEFNNTMGVSLGVIFSAGSANGEDENVFAPVLSIDFLDFQLGYGVELGTRENNQKRGFFTVAYSIPLYKLVKGKYRIIKKSIILNDVIEN